MAKVTLSALLRRYGTPVPLAALHRANTVTRREYDRMRAEADVAEKRRRAEDARRAREDRWAEELEAGW